MKNCLHSFLDVRIVKNGLKKRKVLVEEYQIWWYDYTRLSIYIK